MENQEIEPGEEFEPQEEELQEDAVEIYSKKAILWFAILFNPVFGAALLMQNLRDVGYKREANVVIFSAIIYTFIPLFVLGVLQINTLVYYLIVLVCNVSGGLILTEYVFPKYFPDTDYYPKDVTRAIFRAIIISLILVFGATYLQSLTMPPVK